DVKWEASNGDLKNMKVGDMLTITGKVYLPVRKYWPASIKNPDPVYLQSAGPAAVFAKRETYINGTPLVKSTGLELGHTYEFKLVMQARIPGTWHIHPSLQVTGSGPIAGPGEWTSVGGAWSDYVAPVRAGRDGQIQVENLETYSLGNIYGHHIFWLLFGAAWLIWWVRRPTLIPRYRALQENVDHKLIITRQDVVAGVVVLAATVVIVIGTTIKANADHPVVMPLQTGKTPVDPLEEPEPLVKARALQAIYNLPKRALKLEVRITNNAERPVRVAEFATAGIRFVKDPEALPGAAGAALARSIEGYPEEYIRQVLKVDANGPAEIAPGETRTVMLHAEDAVWQIQGLGDVVRSPVRRFGGLIFFYDDAGNRYRQYVDSESSIEYGIRGQGPERQRHAVPDDRDARAGGRGRSGPGRSA
ncbi:MAG: bacterial ammonia monooxygenase, subunit AmoB, partial [Acidobacteriota bacterium]|nr:bacterial ammonia monooxygenase, subunit AmoB [Acidobacteriota bacterium]